MNYAKKLVHMKEIYKVKCKLIVSQRVSNTIVPWPSAQTNNTVGGGCVVCSFKNEIRLLIFFNL